MMLDRSVKGPLHSCTSSPSRRTGAWVHSRGGSMEQELKPAKPWACFDHRYMIVTLVTGPSIIASAWLMKRSPLGSPARLGFGVVEAALIAFFVLYTVNSVRRLDELGQRIQFQAIAIAFAVSAALIAACGVLARAGLPAIDWGLWAWPLM